ncbi:hypothetical protein IFM89_018294 [Coptis chinensis]|uniref:Uncharacterized protein n=1 Tax=Coptis chinensis TaxID=261450 RepID=A0A835GZZ6_9MAGN|nr:hypothetical protein IFM89_018294 [Coptis chinensis]
MSSIPQAWNISLDYLIEIEYFSSGVTFDKYIQLSDLNKRHSTFYVTKTPSDQFGSSAEEGTLTVVWTKDSWANPHLEQAFMSRICAPNWIVF